MELTIKIRKNASTAQVSALTKFMQEHGDITRPGQNLLEHRIESESLWRELTDKLNAVPGGAVKSTEKWKQTWRDIKSAMKKKNLQQSCDTSVGQTSDSLQGPESSYDTDSKEHIIPAKRRHVSFDEEIIKIERDKLELDREYKAQKIEVMARIASALEDIARSRTEHL